jgi:hypothetical protein
MSRSCDQERLSFLRGFMRILIRAASRRTPGGQLSHRPGSALIAAPLIEREFVVELALAIGMTVRQFLSSDSTELREWMPSRSVIQPRKKLPAFL